MHAQLELLKGVHTGLRASELGLTCLVEVCTQLGPALLPQSPVKVPIGDRTQDQDCPAGMSTAACSLRHIWPSAQGRSSTSGHAIWGRVLGFLAPERPLGGVQGKWEEGAQRKGRAGKKRLSQCPDGEGGCTPTQGSRLAGRGDSGEFMGATPWRLQTGMRLRASAEPWVGVEVTLKVRVGDPGIED